MKNKKSINKHEETINSLTRQIDFYKCVIANQDKEIAKLTEQLRKEQ